MRCHWDTRASMRRVARRAKGQQVGRIRPGIVVQVGLRIRPRRSADGSGVERGAAETHGDREPVNRAAPNSQHPRR